MKTIEADFGILFRHWLKANPRFTCACELKQTDKDYISFDCVQQNQLDYLSAINSDQGVLVRVQGTNGEPDYIYLRNEPAYVWIKYPDAFHGISIANFINEKETSRRKSLTSQRAAEIAVVSVPTNSLKPSNRKVRS